MAHALGLQALAHLLEAAAEQQKARTAEEEEGVMQLVQRWMFNLVKKGLTAPNLAVRQVPLLRLHLLLIKMAMWDPYSRYSYGVWFLWSLCKFVMGSCKVFSICRYKAAIFLVILLLTAAQHLASAAAMTLLPCDNQTQHWQAYIELYQRQSGLAFCWASWTSPARSTLVAHLEVLCTLQDGAPYCY